MTTLRHLTETRTAADAAITSATSADYTISDLTTAGLTKYEATKLRNNTTRASHIIRTGTGTPFTGHPDDVVTIVAANTTRADEAYENITREHWYARALDLTLPVPQAATALAVTDAKQIVRVFPIKSRWYVPQPSAKLADGSAPKKRLRSLIDSNVYAQRWPGAASVFLLGAPVDLPTPLPLGYDAVAGTRSYTWGVLTSATQLKGAPSYSTSNH